MNTYKISFSAHTFLDIQSGNVVEPAQIVDFAHKFVQFWIAGMPFSITDSQSHDPLQSFTFKLGHTDPQSKHQYLFFEAVISTRQAPSELANYTTKCRRHTTIPFAASGFTSTVILSGLTDMDISLFKQLIAAPQLPNPVFPSTVTTPSTSTPFQASTTT